ncbi:MAG: HD-GYP domain-containing protein [Thermaerobacter sp.]|nr:HD-GYP domain-containing protein [Thermaerobacter sp.]
MQGQSRSRDLIIFLNQVLGVRDDYVFEHSRRVARIAVAIGRRLGLPREDLEELRLAGLLHDLGKADIPDTTLNKPGPLDEDEWEAMRGHPLVGRDMVHRYFNGEALRTKITTGIMFHHEKWDGSGYPTGLRGKEIPVLARILCLADVFDAMTSERSYHPPRPMEEARAYICQGAGSHFDPEVVDAFLRTFAEEADMAADGGG